MLLTDLLEQAAEAGLELYRTGDLIGVRGDPAAIEQWLPRLRPYRAETLSLLAAREIDACKFCSHLATPGIGVRYCAGRDDLPLAYGPGHPLRRLPYDWGESCQQFVLRQR